ADGPGQSRRAAHDKYRARGELVRVALAPRQPFEHLSLDQPGSGKLSAFHRNPDGDDFDVPRMDLARIHPETDLGGLEGDRDVLPDAGAGGLAGRRVDA